MVRASFACPDWAIFGGLVIKTHRGVHLWARLLESKGDPIEVRRLLDAESLDEDGEQFLRTLGIALTLFFGSSWGRIVALLEDAGISHEELQGILALGLDADSRSSAEG